MFTIYAKTGDEDPVIIDESGEFDPQFAVIDPDVKEEVNKAGTLQFTVYPTHFYFDRFIKMATKIWVIEDGLCIFYGRVLYTQTNLKMDRVVYCEGALSYLLDTLVDVDPLRTVAMAMAMMTPPQIDSTVEEAAYFNFSVRDFVKVLLASHNSQLGNDEKDKCIYFGNVTVNGNSEKYKFDVEGVNNTANYLMETLVEQVGGYIHIRPDFTANGVVLYLDWGNEVYSIRNTQPIEFGSNLLDYSSDASGVELFTVLYPIGKPINDSVNGGNDFHISISEEDQVDYWVRNGVVYYEDTPGATKITGKEYWVMDGGLYEQETIGALHVICSADGKIFIPDGLARYGKIYKSVELSNMTGADDMLNKTLAYIERRYDPLPEKISVTALDLKKLYPADVGVQPLKFGTKIHVYSEPHNIDRNLICVTLDHHLRNPAQNSYELSSEINDKLDNVPIFSKEQRSGRGSSYGGGGGGLASALGAGQLELDESKQQILRNFSGLKALCNYLYISSSALTDGVTYQSILSDNQKTFRVFKSVLLGNEDATDEELMDVLKSLGLSGLDALPDGSEFVASNMQLTAAGLAMQIANQNTILSYLEIMANVIGLGLNDGQGNTADMTVKKDQNGRYVFRFDVSEGSTIDAPDDVPFYSSQITYAVGDRVIYDGKIWKCTTAVTEAEHFDPTKWTQDLALKYYLRDGGSTLQQTANRVLSVIAGSGVEVDADGHLIIDETTGRPRFAGDDAAEFSEATTYEVGSYAKHDGKIYRFTTRHPAGAWNAAHVEEVVTLYSQIEQNKDAIDLRVTQNQMSSALSIKADSASLSTVMDSNGRVTAASIATAIDSTTGTSKVTLDADHILLNGSTTIDGVLTVSGGNLVCKGEGPGARGTFEADTIEARYIDMALNGIIDTTVLNANTIGNVGSLTLDDGTNDVEMTATNVAGLLSGAAIANDTLTISKLGGGSSFTITKSGNDLVISDGTSSITFNRAATQPVLSGSWSGGTYTVTSNPPASNGPKSTTLYGLYTNGTPSLTGIKAVSVPIKVVADVPSGGDPDSDGTTVLTGSVSVSANSFLTTTTIAPGVSQKTATGVQPLTAQQLGYSNVTVGAITVGSSAQSSAPSGKTTLGTLTSNGYYDVGSDGYVRVNVPSGGGTITGMLANPVTGSQYDATDNTWYANTTIEYEIGGGTSYGQQTLQIDVQEAVNTGVGNGWIQAARETVWPSAGSGSSFTVTVAGSTWGTTTGKTFSLNESGGKVQVNDGANNVAEITPSQASGSITGIAYQRIMSVPSTPPSGYYHLNSMTSAVSSAHSGTYGGYVMFTVNPGGTKYYITIP